MKNPLLSFTDLKKAAADRGWFKNKRAIYHGFGPLGADMFRHFMPIAAIVSFYDGEEVPEQIEKKWNTRVFSYERKKGVRHNSVDHFNDNFYDEYGGELNQHLSQFSDDLYYIPFQATAASHKFLYTQGFRYRFAQNTELVRNYFEEKTLLVRIAQKIGIPLPPNSLSTFGALSYQKLQDLYPKGFVLQVPISQAGGGTDIVLTRDHYDAAIERRQAHLGAHFATTPVKVTQFLSGPCLNATGCVVNGEVALSPPDVQICGDPALVSNPAQYVGSDFSARGVAAVHKKEMMDIMRRIGLWLGAHGYQGNFGVDFLTTVDSAGKVDGIYVSEVNARLVGESQYLADWEAMRDIVPLTFFHLASFLHLSEIRPEFIREYNESLTDLEGSAVILFTRQKGTWQAKGGVRAGVYRVENGKLVRVRDGINLSETRDAEEFVLTNGVPNANVQIGHPVYGDEEVSLTYIMTRDSIVDPLNWKVVGRKWHDVLDLVHDKMGLVPCAPSVKI